MLEKDETKIEDIIKELIEDHEEDRQRMIDLYEKYKGDVKILSRRFEDPEKINNKIVNHYRGEIINQIVGYLFGKPITYQLEEEGYDESDVDKYHELLTRFKKRNNIEDLDSKTGKLMSICGYGARLCYIDGNGYERVMNIKPWEAIIIKDASLDETQYAIRYYPVYMKEYNLTKQKEELVERYRVEFYDGKNITFYLQNKYGNYDLDHTVENNPMPHYFDYVPVIKFTNNDEEMGDFEVVDSLVDAYDRLISDAQNEVEEFRQAYMIFSGNITVDKEFIKQARQTGAIQVPDGSVTYLTKDINPTMYENQKKTLNDNIYKFAETVDMSDEKFSGSQQSGEARKWKLLALENKAITKERKFTAALREMFKVIGSSWKKKGLEVDYLDLYWNFTRNIPIDLKYIADSVTELKGVISDQTLLSLMPFIDDVKGEMDRIEEEKEKDEDVMSLYDDEEELEDQEETGTPGAGE